MNKGLVYIFLFILLFIFTPHLRAETPNQNWQVSEGELTYHVHFVLKEVEGVSKGVLGKGKCNSKVCKFLLAAPVDSFKSGDSNRDLHMLEVTKGALYKVVVVNVTVSSEISNPVADAEVVVEFAGQKKEYSHIPIHTKMTGDQLFAKGQLPIKLSDFSVERPSLLGVQIKDNVEVDFSVVFNR